MNRAKRPPPLHSGGQLTVAHMTCKPSSALLRRLSTLVAVAGELRKFVELLLSVPDVAQKIQAALVFFRFLASLFGLPEIVFEIGPFDRQGQWV